MDYAMRVELSLFKNASSLHQVSISRLEADARMWLNETGKSVKELLVTDHHGEILRVRPKPQLNWLT